MTNYFYGQQWIWLSAESYGLAKLHELPLRIPSFQPFVFNIDASRAAPVREAVISVTTRSGLTKSSTPAERRPCVRP